MNEGIDCSRTESKPKPPTIRPGLYVHFKGNHYAVHGVVRHSETQEWMVLYTPLYGDRIATVRPYAMFVEEIERNGKKQPRFSFVQEMIGNA